MNYVSVRTEAKPKGIVKKQAAHDSRLRPPAYLKREPDSNLWIYRADGSAFEVDSATVRAAEDGQDYLYGMIDNSAAEQLERSRVRSKGRGKPPKNLFIRGVITFSSEGLRGVETGKLDEAARAYISGMTAYLGVKPLYLCRHNDETATHYHMVLEGVNGEGKAVASRLYRDVCRDFQDLAGKEFESLGFERGRPKEVTNANHRKVLEMHRAEADALLCAVDSLKTEERECRKSLAKLDEEIMREADRAADLAEHNFTEEAKLNSAVNEIEKLEREIARMRRRLKDMRRTQAELSAMTVEMRKAYNAEVSGFRKAVRTHQDEIERLKALKHVLEEDGGSPLKIARKFAKENEVLRAYLKDKQLEEDFEDWAAAYQEAARQSQADEEPETPWEYEMSL